MKPKKITDFDWIQASKPLMNSVENFVNSRQAILRDDYDDQMQKVVKFSNVDSVEIFDESAPIRKRGGGYAQMIATIFIFVAFFFIIIATLLLVEVWIIGQKNSIVSNSDNNNTVCNSNIGHIGGHGGGDATPTTTSTSTTTTTNKFKWQHCGQAHIESNLDKSMHSPHIYQRSDRMRQRRARHRRIIGGEDAVAHSFPFLASVRVLFNNGSEHHCGGTLITDSHVLTAAHCVLLYVRLLSHLKMNMSQIYSLIEVHVGINQHGNNRNRQQQQEQTFVDETSNAQSSSNVRSDDVVATSINMGDIKQIENENVYGVESFDWHSDFKFTPTVLYNDIAILKLNRPVNLDRPEVNVVCLPEPNQPSVSYGDRVVAIGWGTYAEEYNYTAYVKDELQQAVFQVKDERDPECVGGSVGAEWDRNKTVCAHGTFNDDADGDRSGNRSTKTTTTTTTTTTTDNTVRKSTCYGDSGGPVLAYRNDRWVLVGIISFGHDTRDPETNKKKCDASMPFYFVNVSAYFDWINQKTNFTLVDSFQ